MRVIRITSGASKVAVIQAILDDLKMRTQETQANEAETPKLQADSDKSVINDLQDTPETHVDDLTNAPFGYRLVERHQTEDFALYVRETSSGSVEFALIVGGMLMASDDHIADFNKMRTWNEHQLAYHLLYLSDKLEEDVKKEPKRYIGVYRKFAQPGETETKLHLWAIHNTALMIKQGWSDPVAFLADAYEAIYEADTREEIPSIMDLPK